jgi:putative transcriptional regulator
LAVIPHAHLVRKTTLFFLQENSGKWQGKCGYHNLQCLLAGRMLADKVGITMANISVLKNRKAKAIRLSTLEAICRALECQPGDILEYEE